MGNESLRDKVRDDLAALAKANRSNDEEIIDDRQLTPLEAQRALAAIGCFVSLKDLAEREKFERLDALDWADAIYFGKEIIPDRPEWVGERDEATISDKIQQDHTQYSDASLYRIFHSEWVEPESDIIDDEEDSEDRIRSSLFTIGDVERFLVTLAEDRIRDVPTMTEIIAAWRKSNNISRERFQR